MKGGFPLALFDENLNSEWDYGRNQKLDPCCVSYGSEQIAWWICRKNPAHRWKTKILNRTSGNQGCPFCAGRQFLKSDSFAALNPRLLKEFRNDRNNPKLDPFKLAKSSDKAVWWRCSIDKNHFWMATIGSRTNRRSPSGCPFCSGRRATRDRSFGTKFPDILKTWDYEKNLLDPYDLSPFSDKICHFNCQVGHGKYSMCLKSRSLGAGCPKCVKQFSRLEVRLFCELKDIFPSTILSYKLDRYKIDIVIPEIKIALEVDGLRWHKDSEARDTRKNNYIVSHLAYEVVRIRESGLKQLSRYDLTRINSIEFSRPTIQLFHRVLRHLEKHCILTSLQRKRINKRIIEPEFKMTPNYNQIVGATRVPNSKENSSAFELKPDLKDIWHFELNEGINPFILLPNSQFEVWWKCKTKKKSHNHQMTVGAKFHAKHSCQICTGRKIVLENSLLGLSPELARQWIFNRNSIDPATISPNSHQKAWFRCCKGHETLQVIKNKYKVPSSCKYCSNKIATPENSLAAVKPGHAKFFDIKKNNCSPAEIQYGAGRKVWWICPNSNCNWDFYATPNHFTKLTKCQKCALKF